MARRGNPMISKIIDAFFYSLWSIPGEWRLMGPEGEVAARVSGHFRSGSGNILYASMSRALASAWLRLLS
jgi:hypothetical protein